MKLAHSGLRASGFSLVEVMVALLVISVGLLGIAKMQALAMSSTGGAKMRSIAALEAAGLASALHADRTYWANVTGIPTAPFTVTMSSTAVTAATDTALQNTPSCTTAAGLDGVTTCDTTTMAAYDLNDWLVGSDLTVGLKDQLPPDTTSSLTCYSPAAGLPVGCIISITWQEKLMSPNTKGLTGDAATAFEKTTYNLYVQP